MKCVWCKKSVFMEVCPKCGKSFKAICSACHVELVHKHMSDEERDKKFPEPRLYLLKLGHGDSCYYDDDEPWQQNNVRILEEQESKRSWWTGEIWRG